MEKCLEIMNHHGVTVLELEQMCDVIADVLEAYSEYLRLSEPHAFNTIHETEKASETLRWFGNVAILELDEEDECENPEEDDDAAAWHEDGSSRGCKDCPPEECTGHCMSCFYRTV